MWQFNGEQAVEKSFALSGSGFLPLPHTFMDWSSKSQTMIRLSELTAGHKAVICEFEQDSASLSSLYQETDRNDIHLKLMEMGCVPGEEVCIVKVAPLGDPISISIAGYNLSLRRTEAQYIWVEEVVEKVRLAY